MDTKQKYVRLKSGEIIIFPTTLQHDEFKRFNPISAGFCYLNSEKERVDCFGESFSLGLQSDVREDTIQATKQIFGLEAFLNLIESYVKK